MVGAGELGGALAGAAAQVEHYADFAALGGALDDGLPVPDLVIVPCAGGPPGAQPAAVHAAAARVLGLVQGWLAEERLVSGRLVLLTRHAVAARPGEDVTDLAHAAVWGLVRAAQAEHSTRAIALIDTDGSDASADALAAAVLSPEPQLALAGRELAPRLSRARGTLAVPDAPAWRLDCPVKGTLDSLTLVPHPAAAGPLAAGQVRVAVRAAGLNFRDVLDAARHVSRRCGAPLGCEGAGVVTETGPGGKRSCGRTTG